MRTLAFAMVAAQQLGYIARIAALCDEHGVTCVYAHGPIFEGYCQQATDYVATLNEGIRAAGLEVVPQTPICLDGTGSRRLDRPRTQRVERRIHGPLLHIAERLSESVETELRGGS